jgi:hypothetical protein
VVDAASAASLIAVLAPYCERGDRSHVDVSPLRGALPQRLRDAGDAVGRAILLTGELFHRAAFHAADAAVSFAR